MTISRWPARSVAPFLAHLDVRRTRRCAIFTPRTSGLRSCSTALSTATLTWPSCDDNEQTSWLIDAGVQRSQASCPPGDALDTSLTAQVILRTIASNGGAATAPAPVATNADGEPAAGPSTIKYDRTAALLQTYDYVRGGYSAKPVTRTDEAHIQRDRVVAHVNERRIVKTQARSEYKARGVEPAVHADRVRSPRPSSSRSSMS